MEKYSPEWFHEEAQKPEYKLIDEKADQLRSQFVSQYGIDWLKGLSGKSLLTGIFYNDEDNTHCLCYALEMDKDLKETFGSISGGSAYKFGLFYHKKTKEWTTGSPNKPVILTEEQAIEKGTQIRDDLVEGAEILSSAGEMKSEADYQTLYAKLEHIPEINAVWVLKYYQMLFPDILPIFYGRNSCTQVLKIINRPVSEVPFLRMGEINLFVKQSGISSIVFGSIICQLPEYDARKNYDSNVDTL